MATRSAKIDQKADLIWAIADKLTGVYKPHEYGDVILPLTVTMLITLRMATHYRMTSLQAVHLTISFQILRLDVSGRMKRQK